MSLDPDLVLEKARLFARSDDFLGERWMPAFRALLFAVDAEAGLLPARRDRFAGELVQLLVMRSRIAALLRMRPELVSEPMPAPVVISGLPRTGTTLLHNLLSRVPGNRGYRLWELRSPAFTPNTPFDQPRRERDATLEAIRWIESRAPRFRSIHPLDADGPDECNWLFRHSFATPVFAWTNFIPSYERWLFDQSDRRVGYEEWLLQLKLLRFRSPGGVPILKDPGHLFSLDVLLELCPDATVIVLERELSECVPPLASLCYTLQSIETRPLDPARVGAFALQTAKRGRGTLAAVRARHPDRFIDLAYTELVANPLAVAEKVQGLLGLPWDEEARSRCRRFLDSQTRSEPHRYSLSDFGIGAALDST
jgi:Sulfotransferase family